MNKDLSVIFKWCHLGDIALGRPKLGPSASVAVYRLMQYTLHDSAIKHTDVETARKIFYDAVYNSGKAVFENPIALVASFNEFSVGLRPKRLYKYKVYIE